jgi:hypothetical protein
VSECLDGRRTDGGGGGGKCIPIKRFKNLLINTVCMKVHDMNDYH